MDLLRLWLIIHMVSAFQVSTTAVHYHVHVQEYSNNSVSWIHCKYLKHRLLYYRNSSATFQLNLLKSGDVDPNPGPTTEHVLWGPWRSHTFYNLHPTIELENALYTTRRFCCSATLHGDIWVWRQWQMVCPIFFIEQTRTEACLMRMYGEGSMNYRYPDTSSREEMVTEECY